MADQKSKDIVDNEDLLALLGDAQPEESVNEPLPAIPEIPGTTSGISIPDIPDIPNTIPTIPTIIDPIEVSKEVDENSEYVREVLTDFKKVSKSIIGRFQEDKDEIQEVIDYLKDKVYNSSEVEESHVIALTNTLRTKADASTNAVKLLDAYSKLLSAGKSALGGGGGSKSATSDMLELAKLLRQEKFPDEQ